MDVLTKLAILNFSIQRKLWVRFKQKTTSNEVKAAICDMPDPEAAGPKDMVYCVVPEAPEGGGFSLLAMPVEEIEKPSVSIKLLSEKVPDAAIQAFTRREVDLSRVRTYRFPSAAASACSWIER